MHRLRPEPLLHGEHRRQQLPQHPFARKSRRFLPGLRLHLQGLHRWHTWTGMGSFSLRGFRGNLREIQDLHWDHQRHVPVDEAVSQYGYHYFCQLQQQSPTKSIAVDFGPRNWPQLWVTSKYQRFLYSIFLSNLPFTFSFFLSTTTQWNVAQAV